MKKTGVFILILLLCLAGCGTSDPADKEGGFNFTYNGCQIAMNAEATDVIAALGEPEGYTEEASCAFEGMDKTYNYGSFYLTTYPMEGKDYVYGIWFSDDSVSTKEGIRIGDTQAEVEAVYGADSSNGTNTYALTRTKGETQLTIILADGVVRSIQYAAIFE